MKKTFAVLSIILLLVSCNSDQKKNSSSSKTDSTNVKTDSASSESSPNVSTKGPIADAATILARKQVPILCYHQIRDWTAKDSKMAKDYIIPIASFKEHIKILHDSGYHTILPDQLYGYLTRGA